MGGSSGEGIANNTRNKGVIKFKEKMLDYTACELSWSRSKLDKFITKIITNRNELIAHYDGSVANYQKTEDGAITSMKLPGFSLNFDERNDFEKIVKHMNDFLHRESYI